MRRILTSAAGLAAIGTVGACIGDETVSGYAGGVDWQLTEIDGTPFSARAVISFPEPGRIAGQAPCNSFSGEQTAPYPWFSAPALAVTRRSCPEISEETRFFKALNRVTLAEVQGEVLILSAPDGPTMVFTKSQP